MRLPPSSLLALGLLLLPTSARAGNDLASELAPALNLSGTSAISLGVITSIDSHPDDALNAFGAGAELAYTHYLGEPGTGEPSLFGYGAFLHGEILGLGTQDLHGYAAAGGQLNYLCFGVELGGAFEFLDQSHADTVFVHMAPYISFGVLWIAFHVDAPLFSSGAGPIYQTGYGIELGIQLPLFVGDRPLFEGVRLNGPFGGG